MSRKTLIFLPFIFAAFIIRVGCITYIISSPGKCPPDSQCLTLSQFATNVTLLKESEIHLKLSSEIHILEVQLNVKDIVFFNMSPYYNQSEDFFEKPVITCYLSGEINFNSIAKVIMNGIDFRGCINTKIKSVGELAIHLSTWLGNGNVSLRKRHFGTALIAMKTAIRIFNCTFKHFIGHLPNKTNYLHEVRAPGVVKCTLCDMEVQNSTFMSNEGVYGGAIYAMMSTIFLHNCTFIANGNTPFKTHGGVIYAIKTHLTVSNCELYSNGMSNHSNGGVLKCLQSNIVVHSSRFIGNGAESGGVFLSLHSQIAINKSLFSQNEVTMMPTGSNQGYGAVLNAQNTTIYSENCNFVQNMAVIGGGLYIVNNSQLIISGSNTFTNNTAWVHGSAFHVFDSTMKGSGTLIVSNNNALLEAVVIDSSHSDFSGNFIFHNNVGSLSAFDSDLKISGNVSFSGNSPSSEGPKLYNIQGGGITSTFSLITLKGHVHFKSNCATNGGGIFAFGSKLFFGNLTFYENAASDTGGAMYLQQSELTVRGQVLLTKNTANTKGGAIHLVSSSISLTRPRNMQLSVSKLYLQSNSALKGGAMYLEVNSNLYLTSSNEHMVYFNDNVADIGGAILVDDSTNTGICASDHNKMIEASKSQCFFQTVDHFWQYTIIYRMFNFTGSTSRHLGDYIYGGLLDRCTVKKGYSEYVQYADQFGAFDYICGFTTSLPVRVCFCNSSSKVDCSYRPTNVKVKLGYNFTLLLAAVDQMNHTIKATVRAYLNTTKHRLGEDQRQQQTNTNCSNLTYTVYSLEDIHDETLYLYAMGPCRNIGISKQSVLIDILPCTCPIGFAVDNQDQDKCYCKCEPKLHPYITKCNFLSQSLIREGDFWIDTFTSLNQTFFVIHPHCPYDYCLPASSNVKLNFNTQNLNASDAQCAFDRAGKLCGTCKEGFSLSLGSSRCLRCPTYWPLFTAIIVLAFIIGGILLAMLILACNLTVAAGSLNGLIFYANAIYANKSIYLPFREPNLHTIVIYWTNLNFGLDACFIEGMDSYLKTWLSLAFPTYIVFIMFTIILLCKLSPKFAGIIGRKNPVATLSTLLLLCYTNLLQVVITVASYAVLHYHDHNVTVWLQDATVTYGSTKHIPLLIIVVLIWIFGLTYTILLTFWQCLTKLSDRTGFKWVQNTKLILFMETYHAPYHSKNRFWTGLLLFVRVILYASAAINSSKVPNINLMLTIVLTAFLLTLATTQIYKKIWLNIVEVVTYYNIIVFSIAMLYFSDTGKEKNAIAVSYVSVSISLMLFLVILAYHSKILCSEVFYHVQFKFFATHHNNIMSTGYQPVSRGHSETHSVVGISPTSSNSAQ